MSDKRRAPNLPPYDPHYLEGEGACVTGHCSCGQPIRISTDSLVWGHVDGRSEPVALCIKCKHCVSRGCCMERESECDFELLSFADPESALDRLATLSASECWAPQQYDRLIAIAWNTSRLSTVGERKQSRVDFNNRKRAGF